MPLIVLLQEPVDKQTTKGLPTKPFAHVAVHFSLIGCMVHVLGHPLLFAGGVGSDEFMHTAAQKRREKGGHKKVCNSSRQGKQLEAIGGMQAGMASGHVLC